MLAKKIGWSFVELNKEIEAQNGLSVAEIIALYGQEGFRRMEQAALTQLLARKELMVLATGGGIVSEPLTFDLILSSFYTIWLKAEPEEHMARVRGQGDLRPMADDRSAMAELRNILVSREPLYARASAVVDTAGLSRRCRRGAPDRCGGAGAARQARVRTAQRGFLNDLAQRAAPNPPSGCIAQRINHRASYMRARAAIHPQRVLPMRLIVMDGHIMLERRQHSRNRVYYGGMVAFNARNSTLACVVRNFSPRGAKIEFENSAMLPDRVDFEIKRRGISCQARLVWRERNAAGLAFSNVRETSDVIPLDLARKLRATERANRQLQSRLDQFLTEH